jgi:putative addiction module component (TIGR02574 family)
VEPIERGYTYLVRPVDIASLSTEEPLRLMEDLWESLRVAPERVPLTNAQREELDRRLDDLDREGPTGIPWEEVFSNIRNRGL